MANLQSVGFTTSLTAIAAACMLAGCGGGSDSSSSSTSAPGAKVSISGVVNSTLLTAGSPTTPTIAAGYFKGATVCVDANNDGICEASENPVTTDANGKFTLSVSALGPIIADISTSAINTASSKAATAHEILRASLAQVTEQQAAGLVVVSPMSSEVQRMVEDNGTNYQTEKANLATRIGVTSAQVLADLTTVTGSAQAALLQEAQALNNRYVYATKKFDNKELYPDALAVPGGDPELKGLAVSGATQATTPATDPRTPITFLQAQQAAFNVEGIPRYDSVFIVMLENKGTTTILGSPYAPKINGYLQAGNQFTTYFATGNPSEPNYTALGGADDWGITDDSQWNCGASGANAVQDTEPTSSQAGLANSPFTSPCASAVNHNIVGKPNLFNALTSMGLQWRTYSESMNPGQDFRTDSIADSAVTATDNVYQPGTLAGNPAVIGTPGLVLPMPAGLYKTKHHPGMAYQNVRSAPEWKYSNRTLGGGQWDANLVNGSKYTIPSGYNVDQFGSDLTSGNVGQINFLMPDQCDDMHSISVPGTPSGTASDCSGNNIITRGDNYVDYLVKKIQASPLWANRQKRIAIVLMFDEGTATSGFNSCCGWNPGNSTVAKSLIHNADGTWSQDTSIANYTNGNRGHGESIFAVLTNQASAPKGVKDSDAYSHFSFVRTLQDMFQLADPTSDASYMNRSKYTEKFVAQNIANLPEYLGSSDTHFDAVRPMNHKYVIPAGYLQKQSSDTQTLVQQVGPDTTQAGVWAVK